jgi:hypothetical protein
MFCIALYLSLLVVFMILRIVICNALMDIDEFGRKLDDSIFNPKGDDSDGKP